MYASSLIEVVRCHLGAPGAPPGPAAAAGGAGGAADRSAQAAWDPALAGLAGIAGLARPAHFVLADDQPGAVGDRRQQVHFALPASLACLRSLPSTPAAGRAVRCAGSPVTAGSSHGVAGSGAGTSPSAGTSRSASAVLRPAPPLRPAAFAPAARAAIRAASCGSSAAWGQPRGQPGLQLAGVQQGRAAGPAWTRTAAHAARSAGCGGAPCAASTSGVPARRRPGDRGSGLETRRPPPDQAPIPARPASAGSPAACADRLAAPPAPHTQRPVPAARPAPPDGSGQPRSATATRRARSF